jgi:outer membrane biosynthesis protein TonB
MNIKFIFLSVLVLGLIVNTPSFSDFAFADKPDKEEKKEAQDQKKIQKSEAKAEREKAKAEREEAREEAKAEREEAKAEREEDKAEREEAREEIKIQKKEVQGFGDNTIVTSSSTTTICHIPPGNPGNNHTITIGESALSAHLGHGDVLGTCDYESESNSNEENINMNENAIEQIRKQIESLQKQLQKLLGL